MLGIESSDNPVGDQYLGENLTLRGALSLFGYDYSCPYYRKMIEIGNRPALG